jgi:acetyltransferase-like isoleucine patch superfamily enzyme
MKIFMSILAMVGACVQVARMMRTSIGRRIWRCLNGAMLTAMAGAKWHKVRLGSDVNVLNPKLISCGSGVTIGDQSELLAEPSCGMGNASIEIGDNVKIGKRCQLAANPGVIRICDQASLHSNVVLLGQVNIGRYTLLSANIFASSGNHRAFDSPHLLIRDQDLEASREGREDKPVIIEEDCWIGWSAAIMSGVHIGRGAVVGANAVVTEDVAPYEVVGGQPARRLRKRLLFCPDIQIIAAREEHGPYLYRGFLQSKTERQVIDAQWPGQVGALGHTVIVLSGEPGFSYLQLRGVTLAENVSLSILFESREYVMVLPEKVGSTFDQAVLLSDFRPASDDLDEPDCRVPGARTFSITVRCSDANNGRLAASSFTAWAIHSASLRH